VYATVLALVVGIARVPFPLLPRHLTLISSVSIGIPGFFLALAPNKRRYVPGFLARVARFVVPAGVVSAAAVLAAYGFARAEDAPLTEARTAALIVLGVVSLWVLYSLTRPLVRWQVGLVLSMVGLMTALIAIPKTRHMLELDIPATEVWLMVVAAAATGVALLEVAWRMSARFAPQSAAS
jgi:cation-transporting ATPase E